MKTRADQFENTIAQLALGVLLITLVMLPSLGKIAALMPSEPASSAEPIPFKVQPAGALALVRNDEGGLSKAMKHIYLMRPDASGQVRVTKEVEGWDTAWSPDGSRIAFTCPMDGNLEICVVNVDGSGLTRLTNSTGNDQSPTWSPDGLSIAFASNRRGVFQIYSMDCAGKRQTALTHTSTNETQPAWSPNGEYIAFVTDRSSKNNSMFNRDIFVMDADGSNIAGLTVKGPACLRESPAWSPDNRRIAFASDCAELQFQIYLMDADGKHPARLTMGAGHNRHPAWSADGKQIAFDSTRGMSSADLTLVGDRTQVYLINVDGRGEIKLTDGEYSGHPAFNWGSDKVATAR